MAHRKISRNDPCPCGSGKKFKHCCLGKDIDWEARKAAGTRRLLPSSAPRPRAAPPSDFSALGPYRVIDARLKEIAKAGSGPADLKGLVERLSDTTPDDERMRIYRAVRAAAILPDAAAFFLFAHATQWMLPKVVPGELDQKEAEDNTLDQDTLALLRRYHLDDMADLFVTNQLEYHRRYERGRHFFYGPPDELLAERLRERGIIE